MALLFSLVFLQIGSGNDQKRAQNTGGALMMVLVSTTFQTLYPVVQVLCEKKMCVHVCVRVCVDGWVWLREN